MDLAVLARKATGLPTARVPLALPAEIVPKAIADLVLRANSHRAATVLKVTVGRVRRVSSLPVAIVDRAPRVEIADLVQMAAISIRRVANRAVPARVAATVVPRATVPKADSVAEIADLVVEAIAPTVEIADLASGSIARSRIRVDLASRPRWKASWRSSAANRKRSRTTSSSRFR